MLSSDVIAREKLSALGETLTVGIDVGSRQAKAVLLDGEHIHTAITATGVDAQETADRLLRKVLAAAGREREAVRFLVGTGYGRVVLHWKEVPSEVVTEISCHAMGAHFLHAQTRTIVDVGGQDSKVIQVDPASGKVVKFIMNDKCAAGTGRFLEKAADLLDLRLSELGPTSLKASKELIVSSQCVVFAESEIISLRARGESQADIAAGLHMASARRVKNILSRIPIEPALVFTGGVSNNVGMRKALQDLVGHPLSAPRLDTVFAGALGAAVYAQRYAADARKVVPLAQRTKVAGPDLVARVRDAETEFISRHDVKKVGYLCNYIPVEMLSASGAAAIRLAHAGEPDVVSQGELITKSVFCDFTKSLLGHLANKSPLHDSVDSA